MLSDLLSAVERARVELRNILHEFDESLTREPWWNERWQIRYSGDQSSYITNTDWQDGPTDLIWVGRQGRVDSLFGNESPPELYVWISGNRPGLLRELRQLLTGSEQKEGDLRLRGSGNYVIRRYLRKWVPESGESIEEYLEEFFHETRSFISHYAQFLDEQGYTVKELKRLG